MLHNFPEQVLEENTSDLLVVIDELNLEGEESNRNERSNEYGGN